MSDNLDWDSIAPCQLAMCPFDPPWTWDEKETAECPICCDDRVPKTAFLSCKTCRNRACALCYLKTVAKLGRNFHGALGFARCDFCRQPYRYSFSDIGFIYIFLCLIFLSKRCLFHSVSNFCGN